MFRIHSKKVFIILRVVICLILVAVGCIMVYQYRKVSSLCDQIKNGENIDTTISNAMTAPRWQEEIATILQVGSPRIPLVEACYYRNIQAVEVLLANGADPNIFFKGRFSPLEAAIVYGPIDENSYYIIKLLIDHGADVNKFGSEAPLIIKLATFIAAGNDNPIVQDIVMLLFEQNADCYFDGYNKAVFYMVMGGKTNLVSAYLDKNPHHINDLNEEGQSFLIEAIIQHERINASEMVELLLSYGINTKITDSSGYSAYDYAMQYGLSDIAEIIS